MTSLAQMADELRQRTAWQQTPVEMIEEDYLEMVRQAIRHLYVMTGRFSQYADGITELDADEYEYTLTTAEIGFYRRVQSDVNRMIGYSTDAMTITNADKPYANISQTIAELLNRQRILYYKMVRYTML